MPPVSEELGGHWSVMVVSKVFFTDMNLVENARFYDKHWHRLLYQDVLLTTIS
jgi:hypothetical protein